MVTVQRLKPNVTDIEWLKTTNLKVVFDGDLFVRNYLENVLEFKPDNILKVDREYKYAREFESNNIAAAFLELPYEKAFMSHYCKGYRATRTTYRFGGFGFMSIFQKGSPIAADFSEAILKLSENGELKSLEEKWFAPSPECSGSAAVASDETERLSFQNFWGLFLISGTTSTICVLLFLVQNYIQHQDTSEGNITSSGSTFWSKVVGFAKYIYNRRERKIPGRSSALDQTPDEDEWRSSSRESGSPSDTSNNLQESSESDIEVQCIPGSS